MARLFLKETSAVTAAAFYDPFREKGIAERPQMLRYSEIKNRFSADDGQSATTTTAASGGNREELLGQRPARRKCRPRHEADAGCRNPIAAAILIVLPAKTAELTFSGGCPSRWRWWPACRAYTTWPLRRPAIPPASVPLPAAYRTGRWSGSLPCRSPGTAR